MSFQARGLNPESFEPLFTLSDGELAAAGARRVFADEVDAYPCRISLTRVDLGSELLLVNHTHQPTPTSPYRASGPIFVSRATEAGAYRDELPPILRNRLVSLRAYDAAAFIVDAEVGENGEVERLIARFFADPAVSHVDAHFAKRGCFGARFMRD
ncbi:DUF1203 domain-containing protein [Microvirga flavescens]|uniref:DUF1203 domain-containing protein n=1 Tax=Microvirga flavescens TaxID=2249811 RepID=UPI000DD97FFC|nr:DUF1203 domain-containing protein [Microvirga flavescens]